MKHLFQVCLFFIFLSPVGYGQELFIISGKTIDSETKEPVSAVFIECKSSRTHAISNQNGDFEIRVHSFPVRLMISHVSYFKLDTTIGNAGKTVFTLQQKTYQLPDVTISKTYKALNDEQINVVDYTFVNNQLIVLGYFTKFNKSCLLLINDYGDTISKTPLEYRAFSIRKNYLNEIEIESTGKVYTLKIENNAFKPVNSFPIPGNEELILPYNLLFGHYLITHIDVTNQLKIMAFINLHDSVLNYFKIIDNRDISNNPANWGINDLNKKQFNFDWLNSFNGTKLNPGNYPLIINEEGIFKEDDDFEEFLSDQNQSNEYLLNRNFFLNVIDKPVYTPIFTTGNKLLLFDHVMSRIEFYDKSVLMEKWVPINYHKNKFWNPVILQDSKTNDFYSLNYRAGVWQIFKINVEDGSVSNAIDLPFSFVSNIKVNNGFVYFLYRDEFDFSTGKNTIKLYKSPLKFNI